MKNQTRTPWQKGEQDWKTGVMVHLLNIPPDRPTDHLRIVVQIRLRLALKNGGTPSMLVELTQTCSADDDEIAL